MNESILKAYNKNRRVMDKTIPCYAPYTNLNFEQGGSVTACCYNRNFVLGKYPEDSLLDIWNGEKVEKLRSYLKKLDFSKGCQLCEHQLESENFSGSRMSGFDTYVEQDYLRNKIKHLFGFKDKIQMPRSMEFELDNTCNLECVMCSGKFSSLIRKNREKLPPIPMAFDDEFVNQLRNFIPFLHEAKFLGGEPFLTPIYFKIWEAILELNPNMAVSITTNATVLTKKVKELLDKLKVNVILSIDSLNKETYSSIRINANFERVMENLQYFKLYAKRNKRKLSFALCPMTLNAFEMTEIMSYCAQNEIKIYFNTVVQPVEYSIRSMLSSDIQKIINHYLDFYQKFHPNTLTQKRNKQKFNDLIKQLINWQKEAQEKEKTFKSIEKAIKNTEIGNDSNQRTFIDLVIKSQHLYLFNETTPEEEKHSFKSSLEALLFNTSQNFAKNFIDILIAIKPQNIEKDAHLQAIESLINKSHNPMIIYNRLLDVGIYNISDFLSRASADELNAAIEKEFGVFTCEDE